MTRRATLILVGAVLAVPLLGILAIAIIVPRMEFAGMATSRATASLGRAVTVESLRITPGFTTTIALRRATIANIEGGSTPTMVTLEALHARLALLPLLRGDIVLHAAEVDGLLVVLERTADRRRNWRFGSADPAGPSTPPTPDPPDRSGLPLLHDARFARSAIVFRTSSGTTLRTRIESGSLAAAAPDQKLMLRMDGAYNDVPITLEGVLGTPEQLRDGRTPFPMTLHAISGETRLSFAGTSADPLNFDRLDGRLTLLAPTPAVILAIAGGGDGPAIPVELAGAFIRNGDIWRLRDAAGTLDGAALSVPLLGLAEGADGQPDGIAVEADFSEIDINRLLGPPPGGAATDDDIPLTGLATPDPLLRVRLSAQAITYRSLRGTDVRLAAELVPGRLAVESFSLGALGGRIEGAAAIEAKEGGGTITGQASLEQVDVDALRRALGVRVLHLRGRVAARVSIATEGATLNAARDRAHVSAVVAMRGGSVSREVIELASTDIQALFRTADGQAPLTCLLAVVDMRGGRGEVAPLRIRAATGTISGLATFDLNRERLDLVIGSQRETTGFFALDIPVRISGSFDNPAIAPATWSREGRARLAAGDRVAPLPPALRTFAQASPCYRAG